MKFKSFSIILLFALALISQSCSKPDSYQNINGDDDSNGSIKTSSASSSKSHNMGMDCMTCHKPGGQGEGYWKVAGTVYNPDGITTNSNVVIKLYTGPNQTGTLKYTLTADAKGNFYTNQSIDFTGGLYPAVKGATMTYTMSNPITVGNCNSCHTGSPTERIFAE